jgi:hypothetical protein
VKPRIESASIISFAMQVINQPDTLSDNELIRRILAGEVSLFEILIKEITPVCIELECHMALTTRMWKTLCRKRTSIPIRAFQNLKADPRSGPGSSDHAESMPSQGKKFSFKTESPQGYHKMKI